MNKGCLFIGSIGLGAGLMYLLDPDRGKRRRFALRDKAIRMLDKADGVIEQAGQDIRNHARGVAIEALALLDGMDNRFGLDDTPGSQNPQPRAVRFNLQEAKPGWSTGRLLARIGGGALLLYGRRRGDLAGKALSAIGVGMALHGINHIEWKRLLGTRNGRQLIHVQGTIEEKPASNGDILKGHHATK